MAPFDKIAVARPFEAAFNLGKCWVGKLSRNDFVKDEKGVSAVEFALILPGLMAMWLGFYSLVEIQDTSTRVGKVSAAAADIISQAPAVTPDQIDAAMDAAFAIMGSQNPNLSNRANDVEIEVVGVSIDQFQRATVVWRRGRNVSSLPNVGSNYDIPSDLRRVPGFVVAARSRYLFRPPFGSFLKEEIDLEYKNYFIPRISDTVECNSC